MAHSSSRFQIHFTPTTGSWLNIVERFFRDLTQNRLRRGVFHDAEELITAIGEYIDKHNQNPKPFIWTAKASDILEKVKRARRTLDNRHSARRTPLAGLAFQMRDAGAAHCLLRRATARQHSRLDRGSEHCTGFRRTTDGYQD